MEQKGSAHSDLHWSAEQPGVVPRFALVGEAPPTGCGPSPDIGIREPLRALKTASCRSFPCIPDGGRTKAVLSTAVVRQWIGRVLHELY